MQFRADRGDPLVPEDHLQTRGASDRNAARVRAHKAPSAGCSRAQSRGHNSAAPRSQKAPPGSAGKSDRRSDEPCVENQQAQHPERDRAEISLHLTRVPRGERRDRDRASAPRSMSCAPPLIPRSSTLFVRLPNERPNETNETHQSIPERSDRENQQASAANRASARTVQSYNSSSHIRFSRNRNTAGARALQRIGRSRFPIHPNSQIRSRPRPVASAR